jgi:hypothetical protein
MTAFVRVSKQRLAAMEQDKAAGGIEKRKIHTKTGGIAVVSIAAVATGDAWRVTLRFKWGGSNVQRPIGAVAAASRTEALKLAWDMLRREHIIESNGWTWAEPGNVH